MAANAVSNNPALEGQQADEEKVLVGNFAFNVTPEDLKTINDKIGDVLEAQVILRGSNSLGYGFVKFNGPSAAGDIAGDAQLFRGRGGKRGRAARGRAGKKAGGRVRRSADDPAGEDDATAEESAQNGNTSVKAVTEGVEKLSTGEGATRGKGKKARGAARAPRERKERGEPSKTLVFIRNLPYSITEEGLAELFAANGLTYKSLTIPEWKYGQHKGKGRGYAFATVESELVQQAVIEALNGKELSAGEAKQVIEGDQAAGEGAPIETERKLRIVARQGYENEDTAEEKTGEQNGTAGPEDSGTAEQTA